MSKNNTIHTMPIPNFEEEAPIDTFGSIADFEHTSKVSSDKIGQTSDDLSEDEAEPVDLFGQFPTPELPWALLPAVVQAFAEIKSSQIGCDPAGLVMAALTACAAATPDNVKVKVQAHNEEWQEPARLWTAIIGPPSSKKTPILNAASKALRTLDLEMQLEWRAEKRAYNTLPKEQRRDLLPPPPRRLVIEDTTIEAALGILAGSPWGVCVLHDELAGFFGAMEKYGGAGVAHDRTVWLRSFNGGSYVINRKSNEDEGGILVPNLSASMLGGIQPDVLKRLVEQSVDDGMIQRFMPMLLKSASVGKDEPMPDVMIPFEELIRSLHDRKADILVSFDEEAQAVFAEAQEYHQRLQAIEMVYKQLSSHIGKYDGIFARLCLLWHCIEHAQSENLPPQINVETAKRVRDFLHGFLLKHAFAFYAGTLDSPDGHDRLRALATHILAHEKTELRNRDVQSSVRSIRGLKDRDIRPLFEQLAALGWLHRVEGMRAGSPPHWRVNPRVHVLFKEKAQDEVRRRGEVRALIAEAAEVRREGRSSEEC